MRFTTWLAALLVGLYAFVGGCAQQPVPPPETIGDWMQMDQVRP